MNNYCIKCQGPISSANSVNGYDICFNCLQISNKNWQSGVYNAINMPKYFDRGVVQLEIPEPLKGTKNDQEKPDLSLIPKDAMFEMAKAFTYGANKYGRHNYREGIEITRLLAAAMRHITEFNEGEDYDEESKALHIGNAMAGLAMAIYMYKNKPEMDNRYKVDKIKK